MPHKQVVSIKKKYLPRSFLSAFTLIELLIVISIIGILAAFALASFSSAQARARDAQRKSDLNQLQKALQLFYSDNNRYPVTFSPPGTAQQYAGGAGWTASCWAGSSGPWIPELTTGNIKKQPHDPKEYCAWPGDGNSGGGTYAYASDGNSYALVALLENKSDSQRDAQQHYPFPWGGADTSTFCCGGAPYTYWVTNP